MTCGCQSGSTRAVVCGRYEIALNQIELFKNNFVSYFFSLVSIIYDLCSCCCHTYRLWITIENPSTVVFFKRPFSWKSHQKSCRVRVKCLTVANCCCGWFVEELNNVKPGSGSCFHHCLAFTVVVGWWNCNNNFLIFFQPCINYCLMEYLPQQLSDRKTGQSRKEWKLKSSHCHHWQQ